MKALRVPRVGTNLIVFRFERVTSDHDEDLIFVPARCQIKINNAFIVDDKRLFAVFNCKSFWSVFQRTVGTRDLTPLGRRRRK